MATDLTDRSRAKADRQSAIVHEAARLFAARGFTGVSLEDIGTAVGVSGPAVYRHFANKQALLGAILIRVSERLLAGGREVAAGAGSAPDALDDLVRFHVDFALDQPDVIRVQDRDLPSLGDADRSTVRRLQREYIEVWLEVLRRVHPDRPIEDLRVRAHATFGLINSTPHSTRGVRTPGPEGVRSILHVMALAALNT